MVELFAQIFTAIGTVGAVIASLWLANRKQKITVKADIALNMIYIPSEENNYESLEDKNFEKEFITITVTNQGLKPFIIYNFIIHDRDTKTFLQSMPDYHNQYCTKSGHLFSESETGTFIFPKRSYLESLNKTLKITEANNIISRVKKIEFFINTNLDQRIKVKPKKGFYSDCEKYFKSIKSQSGSCTD
jgi:hypothetical protein